ncbi:hypothetical protein A2U01_0118373, partial [Trifolium medium]|nr:hypothetical protein [Trifolium medium]
MNLSETSERFNKEAVQVNTTDDMKKYLLERGLRPRSDFAKEWALKNHEPWTSSS